MVQDYDADRLSDEARERLHRYGIGVEEPATVEIHVDTRALGDREDARGGYSPQLDTIQLYEPLFESGAGPEEALVHEYVHKYQIDSRAGPPGEQLHETVAELDELSERYAAMLEDLDHEDADAIADLGAGGITGDQALMRRLSLAVDPGMAEHIHDLAVEEYERLEDDAAEDRLRRYFADALAWEAEQRWGDASRIVGPMADRTTAMDLAEVSIGPEEEAVAYYAGIAAAGRVDDTDYIEAEKEEIRDPDRNYEDPQRQVEVLDELLEQHRSLVDEGHDDDEAVRTVLSEITG
jgi:hypothetical protein